MPVKITTRDKLLRIEDELNEEFQERSEQIHTMLLAVITKRNHFQGGPPGTGKSLMVERLIARIGGLDDDDYFRWLLTKQSVAEELYGPWDLKGMKIDNVMKRNTFRKLPRARFVFLDEFFRGNGTIINANLTAMNEKLFFNLDDDPHIPVISFFGAANSTPGDDDFTAIWDRLDFRHWTDYIEGTSEFVKMLETTFDPEPAKLINIDELEAATNAVSKVKITDSTLESIVELRSTLAGENINVTDRRWVNCIPIIKAEAYLNGHDIADNHDLRPLAHVLWSDHGHYPKVRSIVWGIADPVDRDAQELLDEVNKMYKLFKVEVADKENDQVRARASLAAMEKVEKAIDELNTLKERAKEAGRKSLVVRELQRKLYNIAEELKVAVSS